MPAMDNNNDGGCVWEFREVSPVSTADQHAVLMVVRTGPCLLSHSAKWGWTARLPGGLPDYEDTVGFQQLIDVEEALVREVALSQQGEPQKRVHADDCVVLSETRRADHVSASGGEIVFQVGWNIGAELSMPSWPVCLQLVLRRRGLSHGLGRTAGRPSYSVAWELDAVFYGAGGRWPPETTGGA
jgi:hypothetical protein